MSVYPGRLSAKSHSTMVYVRLAMAIGYKAVVMYVQVTEKNLLRLLGPGGRLCTMGDLLSYKHSNDWLTSKCRITKKKKKKIFTCSK